MEDDQILKKLRANRASIKSRLTIFKKYVAKCHADTSAVNVREFNTRFERFEGLLSEFDSIQSEIDALSDETDFEKEFLAREEFENSFYSVFSDAQKFSTLYDKKLDDNHSQTSFQSICEHNPPNNDSSGIKLPLIKLPTFSGEPREWLQFQDIFEGLIIQNSKITNVQKFHYLKCALQGEALETIANFQLTNDNFIIAWDTLKDQYIDKRALLHEHTKALYSIDVIKKESSKALKHIVDHIKMHLRSLKVLGEPTEYWDTLLIYFITSKLDPVTTREWETKLFPDGPPNMEDLLVFLTQKSKMLKKIEDKQFEQNHIHNTKVPPVVESFSKNKIHSHKVLHSSFYLCHSCNSNKHKTFSCPKFLKMQIPERIKFVQNANLCINCLFPGHQVDQCRSSLCKICSAKHNSLLHIQVDNVQGQDIPIVSLSNINSEHQVLLSTILLQVVDSQEIKHECCALLDSASQSNFISSKFCKLLGVKTQHANISVSGIAKIESKIKHQCQIQIFSRLNEFSTSLSCLVIPDICGNLPDRKFNTASLSIPPNIKMADPKFNSPKPILNKTKFGWILSGVLGNQMFSDNLYTHCNFSKNIDIQNQLSRFWEIENCPEERSFSLDEKFCEDHFVSTHARNSDGRFVVSIPLKESISKLGDSRKNALIRFYNLERKLQRNNPLKNLYVNFMTEYESLGHMSKVAEPSSEQIQFFLPHHGVLKEDSLTTKLRVVYDGSYSSSTGWSINNLQAIGPTIQNDLFLILLRFRQHQFVASADICKMYRQVLVEPSQRCLQQILWRANPTDQLSTYQLNTVTYGTSAASFLAIRPLFQLSSENKDLYPTASKIIENDFYVDDLLTGSDSLEELSLICKQVSDILKQGCFDLRKWVSNDSKALIHVQDSFSDLNILQLGSNEKSKTLGLLWCPQTDHLTYSINHSLSNSTRVTKRIILSHIAQIFDPLGLLSPCTITAKIILQKLWQEKLSWDESVPSDIHSKWLHLQNELTFFNNCQIPRHVKGKSSTHLQLHIFSDSSEGAYGACAYIRSINDSEQICVHLLCAKTKVAPLSTITLPRLELCGAVIAAKLSRKIQNGTRLSFYDVFHWTDSTIVLGWINTSSNLLKTFVANRVSEIQTLTKISSWHHVVGKDNPADLLSRGLNPESLMNSQFWWHGPKWLLFPQHDWPTSLQSDNISHKELPELKNMVSHTVLQNRSSLIQIQKFSNLNKLKRIAAYCIRFINNCTPGKRKRLGLLSASEIHSGIILLVKLVQQIHFATEIIQLSKHRQISKNSKIHKLSPFLDNGVIRVGGRLKYSHLDYDTKHPILLPQKDHFTTLIFQDMHNKLLHTGPSHLLATVREQFWTISGRNVARKIVHNCITCFRAKPKFNPPFMGELPKDRVTPSFPFYVSGIDYAGPFILKDRLGRGCKTYKAWVCLFVCLTSKCIHLEIATDLTKDSFISCLRRFVSRRGKPCRLWSDNGTNFTGAKSEIDEITIFLQTHTNSVENFCAGEGIEWKFIPAYSPHFGGLWEGSVKSLKFHLKRIMNNVLFVYEDFQTILIQIESILNSRPLHPASCDPNDLNPITPAHFLIGRSFTALPDLNFIDVPENRLNRFQHLQKIHQHIWKRWSKDYLTELQHRQKWSTKGPNILLGTLVIIKDNTPPLHWKLGRVITLHPGQDGIVRAVTLKTASGEVRRAVANLCPLPISSV